MMHAGDLGMWTLMGLFLVLPLLALAGAGYLFLRMPRPLAAVASPAARSLPASQRRLLDEDERRLYDLVAARAGDAPQGDLAALSGFSKAKVSRVVDRLERKGLVVRVRRGMGNHVLLAAEETP